MVYTSLAVLAMSASAAMSPLSSLVHLHPRTQVDNRISVTLYNNAHGFRDVKVDGHSYTVEPRHSITIKAPQGTVVYADSRTPQHQRGDTLLELKPELDKHTVQLN